MNATLCKTKAGKGFKLFVNNRWLFVSKEYLLEVIEGRATSCRFSEIEDKE